MLSFGKRGMLYDQTYVSTYAWWSSFKPIALVLELKVHVTSCAETTL